MGTPLFQQSLQWIEMQASTGPLDHTHTNHILHIRQVASKLETVNFLFSLGMTLTNNLNVFNFYTPIAVRNTYLFGCSTGDSTNFILVWNAILIFVCIRANVL